MTELQAKNLAEELMAKHLPKRWTYKTNNRTSSLGLCHHYDNRIEISTYTIKAGKDVFVKTLMHEIAHALDWERHKEAGHGPTWRNIMRELGQPVEVRANEKDGSKFAAGIRYKYDIHCENPDCDVHFNRMRRSKAAKHWYCSKCHNKGIYSRFIWTKNF